MPQNLQTPLNRQIESNARALPYTIVGVVMEAPRLSGGAHVVEVGLPVGMDAPEFAERDGESTTYRIDPSLYGELSVGADRVNLSSLRRVQAVFAPVAGLSTANVKVGDFVVLYSYGHAGSYWHVVSVVKKDTQKEAVRLLRRTAIAPAVSP